MQTCNISKSPKEYTHLRTGSEPNIAKALFFLGCMSGTPVRYKWAEQLCQDLTPVCLVLDVLRKGKGTLIPPTLLKSDIREHQNLLINSKQNPLFFNLQYFNSFNFSQDGWWYHQCWEPHSLHSPTASEVLMMSFSPTKETLSTPGPELRSWQVNEGGT